MIDVEAIPQPTDEELQALPRDLAFRPVRNEKPEHLSLEQINRYNERGYLMPFQALDENESDDLRTFFDNVLAQAEAAGRNSYSVSTAHLRHGRIYDLMSHPRILGPVADLLGPNVVAWGAHFFCKLPRDGKRVGWHQDAAYWPITPTRTVTAWLAIDQASPENANMRFLPRTHLRGALPYQRSRDESEVLNLLVPEAETYGDDPVDVTLTPGHFSLHSDLLLHGSEANDSDKRRCGLTLRYAAAQVRAHYGWHQKGILVQGQDLDNHWVNHPRPE